MPLAWKQDRIAGVTQVGHAVGRPGRQGICSTWVMHGVTDVTVGPLHRFSTPSNPPGSAQAPKEFTRALSRCSPTAGSRHAVSDAAQGGLTSALEYSASRRATGGRRVRPAPVRIE